MRWFIDSSSTLWFFASLTHWFIGSTTHFTKCNVQPWLRWVLDRVSFCQNCFEILSFKQFKRRTKWKTWDNLGKVRKQEKTWTNTDVLRCIELRTMKPNLIDHVPLQVLNFHPKVLQLHFFFPQIDSMGSLVDLTHWFIGSDSSTQQFTRSLVHWFIGSFDQLCMDSLNFIRISTTICTFVGAPHNLNNSLLLHRTNFAYRSLVSHDHVPFSKLSPRSGPDTTW